MPRNANETLGSWRGELRALLEVSAAEVDAPATGEPRPGSTARRAGIAILCFIVYGATAGLFQGGSRILESACKAPLVVALSLLLCAPSLVVFSSLSGFVWSGRRLAGTLAGYAALAGLVMVGLLPVAWLFSVSSRYLGGVTLVHTGCWIVASVFAGRFLTRSLRRPGAAPWTLLVFLVSLQAATLLRPLLWRQPADGWRARERRFFLQQFFESAPLKRPGEISSGR
jgi:hypothetical protein